MEILLGTNPYLPDTDGDVKDGLISGDSGNPMFIIINDQPVLLTLWTGGGVGSGTSVTAFKNDINALMSQLDFENGNATTYQLEEVDLSGFTVLAPQ